MGPTEMVLRSLSPRFKDIREIGEGTFSVVYSAREKESEQRQFAIKTCFKRQLIKEKKVEYVHREKMALARLSAPNVMHPLIVSLAATMQDEEHLYFVMSLGEKGDLLHHMLRLPSKCLPLSAAVFYSAELLVALQHCHKHGIVHRDVKPENILLRANGHCMLSDFGSCKDLRAPPKVPLPVPSSSSSGSEEETEERVRVERDENRDERRRRCIGRRLVRRSSFVGTAQYVSPEVLDGSEATIAVDYWAFAVVVYQMITGKHCFHDESEYLIFSRIKKLLYKYPEGFPASARDLIDRMLRVEPTSRFGCSELEGPDSIKSHAFFAEREVTWDDILTMKPPTKEEGGV